MMPELGEFAAEVLIAYGASIALLVGIIAVSLRRSRKVRRELAAIETRRNGVLR